MAERTTASDQLVRILTLLPFAARDPDLSYTELEQKTGFTREQIISDLSEVYTRSFYHPAGSADETQVIIEADHVYVWTAGDFKRPARLSPSELLTLGLGLRVLAAESDNDQQADILGLAQRLERSLGGGSAEEMLARFEPEADRCTAEGVRPILSGCARDRTVCLIEYLKPGAASPESREVEPYLLVAARGHWYVMGRCPLADAVRTFRLDRIIRATALQTEFIVPEDFEPADYLHDRGLFTFPAPVPVTVRYSVRIARWISEKWKTEPLDEGDVLVRHQVADSRWLVRHVLQYGPDAEVIEPPEYREMVVRALQQIDVQAQPT
jgi:proteasome accessory factor C